jgi:molybdopterin/thiamine biosynthesis adenylyltransferase
MIDLTESQIERYSRHILLQDVGLEGQEKILNAKVLIIGAGGLGAPAAMYLAAAGVGTIGIVDGDVVDLSNLQRQIIHFTKDVGRPKVESAKEKMEAINPDVKVNAIQEFLYSDNIMDIIKDYDFIIDGTDNFPVKFLINDACVKAGKAFQSRRYPPFPRSDLHPCPRFRLLPLYVQGAATSRSRADLLPGRCLRCHRRYVGNNPGCRGAKIYHGYRPVADKPLADLRCQDDGVPHHPRQAARLLPRLRITSDNHGAHRLRTGSVRPA